MTPLHELNQFKNQFKNQFNQLTDESFFKIFSALFYCIGPRSD